MLIKLKRTRTHHEDRNLALCLATSAGLLNAVALAAFGFFPSHMSGNVSQISPDLNQMDIYNLKIFVTLIAAFVTGAVVARIAVVMGIIKGIRTIFSCILLAEGVLLILTSLFELYYFSMQNNVEVLLLLAFLMGVHNATSTQLSNGRVRSTHITGTLTDAGISLGSVFMAMLRRDPSKNIRAFRQQFTTHLVTIFSFLTGGIAGWLFYNALGFGSLMGPGIVLVLIASLSILFTLYKVKTRRYGSALRE
ncbi:YoaK family protein [Pantoea sp.]|uniref:YoaK family protein n=1 Tax=Pantoea sp. TaxID=69393 RepID=UPI0031DBCD54